jgi:hypothetical protein
MFVSHTQLLPSQATANMPGAMLATTNDVNQIEAPVTWKAYLICAFASFGGIFFGYDSGKHPLSQLSQIPAANT